MDNEDLIRDQMEETRASLTEKLETLEEKVASKVEGATANVTQAVEAVTEKVQETVSAVSGGVEKTVQAVKGTVEDSAQAVKDFFDISGHFERHPCLMFWGVAAAGFVVGKLFGPRKPVEMPMEALADAGRKERERRHFREPHHGNGHGRHAERKPEKSKGSSLLDAFAPELQKLKGLAIGALMGTVREMVAKNVSGSMAEPLTEILDSVTEKIGGSPMPQEHEESRPEIQMGGSRLSGFPGHN
jgi:hypothetical protein